MKKRVWLWIVGMLFFTSALVAQEVPVGVITALKKGSAQELSRYLGDKVNLNIQNRLSNTNSEEAEKAINAFFVSNRVSGFEVNHQGKRDDSSYVIGTLTTANGNFRVNCFFKKKEEKYVIHQIRIDKTNE